MENYPTYSNDAVNNILAPLKSENIIGLAFEKLNDRLIIVLRSISKL
jgi:hypothetical protein